MTTMLIACNETVESGSFMGDQLCSLKTAYLFAEHRPPDTNRILMSMSPNNQLDFLWTKFIRTYNIEVIHDDFDAGNWAQRWTAWDKWRSERSINGIPFDHYRELYLRIHGCQRQNLLCGSERGLGRRNIYQYWWCGQEGCPDELPPDTDWFDDTLIYHPSRSPDRDCYISPVAKTQGNYTFTLEFWADVIHQLVDAGISVTCGWDNYNFCADLERHPLFRRHWGSYQDWMEQICRHRLVACGNTGTGWLAAACGVPLLTMEPPNSQMPDHRYRQCGLRNIVEVVDVPDVAYVARRIREEVRRKLVLTTGCYDILHAGHIRHLEKSRALGSKLVVALNSDNSVRGLKGPDRPINPQEQRKTVLEALRCVDEVRIFDGADAQEVILELRPDVLTAGFGYTPERIIGNYLVESWGGKSIVTCTGDARDEPSTTRIASKLHSTIRQTTGDILDICRAAQPYTVNPFDKLKLLADEFLTVAGLEGDVADLGTCHGGTALILRRLAPDKHLHCFDTWEGNPYNDPLCHHKKGEWPASLEECQRLVGQDQRTHYHRGTFPEWDGDDRHDEGYRPAGENFFCFVYLDMDTYQSTRDAIASFWPHIVPGGKIILDDYGWEPCAGVKKAVDEVFHGHNMRVIQGLHTCIIEKGTT